jgi:hypothetical protein
MNGYQCRTNFVNTIHTQYPFLFIHYYVCGYRYRKCVRRMEDGIREPGLVVPEHEGYPRGKRQPPGSVATELVFFCRRVYDFRQRRILKNPGWNAVGEFECTQCMYAVHAGSYTSVLALLKWQMLVDSWVLAGGSAFRNIKLLHSAS